MTKYVLLYKLDNKKNMILETIRKLTTEEASILNNQAPLAVMLEGTYNKSDYVFISEPQESLHDCAFYIKRRTKSATLKKQNLELLYKSTGYDARDTGWFVLTHFLTNDVIEIFYAETGAANERFKELSETHLIPVRMKRYKNREEVLGAVIVASETKEQMTVNLDLALKLLSAIPETYSAEQNIFEEYIQQTN